MRKRLGLRECRRSWPDASLYTTRSQRAERALREESEFTQVVHRSFRRGSLVRFLIPKGSPLLWSLEIAAKGWGLMLSE